MLFERVKNDVNSEVVAMPWAWRRAALDLEFLHRRTVRHRNSTLTLWCLSMACSAGPRWWSDLGIECGLNGICEWPTRRHHSKTAVQQCPLNAVLVLAGMYIKPYQ